MSSSSDTIQKRIVRYSDLPLRIIISSPFEEHISQTYGMMVYAADTSRWLMIQRRHSMSLLILLKGNYCFSEIPSLVSDLVPDERDLIEKSLESRLQYASVLFHVYQDISSKPIESAWKKLEDARPIIERALRVCPSTEKGLAWLWPKGYKRSGRVSEESRDAAMREFKEESGLGEIGCPIVHSHESVTYTNKTMTGRVFTTQCWICVLKNEVILPEVTEDEVEVASRSWLTTEQVAECLKEPERIAFEKGREIAATIMSIFV